MSRMTEVITVLKSDIPVSPGSQLYDGFVALKKCHGKSYQAFRDMCGGTKGSSGRKFSPSTVRRKAEELGFAMFGASTPSDVPPVNERRESRRDEDATALRTNREASVRILDGDFEAELF